MDNVLGNKSLSTAPLLRALKFFAKSNPRVLLSDVSSLLEKELRSLAASGTLALGSDKDLTGANLEIRSERLFQDMHFRTMRGRAGCEDFVVSPPSNATTAFPLVIEGQISWEACVAAV